jgi:hypothetical protein
MHMLGIRVPNQLLFSACQYKYYSGPANSSGLDKIQTLSAKGINGTDNLGMSNDKGHSHPILAIQFVHVF